MAETPATEPDAHFFVSFATLMCDSNPYDKMMQHRILSYSKAVLESYIAVVAEQPDYNQYPAQNKDKRSNESGYAPVHPYALPVAKLFYAVPFLALPRPFVAFDSENDHGGYSDQRKRY